MWLTRTQFRASHHSDPDYGADTSLTVVVQVSDGLDATHNQDAAIDDTITVSANLTNVHEPGCVVISSLEPEVDTALAATLNDRDGNVSTVSWQWANSPDDGITWADIAGATSDTYTPTSDDAGILLRTTVSYTDGEGSGKGAFRQSTDAVRSPEVQEVDTSLELLVLASIPFSLPTAGLPAMVTRSV